MPRTSWHLDRRTFLRGAGMALAVPWLEAMSQASPPAERPKRFCAFFFGNGVALPARNQAHFQDWHWFPHTVGADYRLNRSLDPLETHKRDMTIFGGLSHATSRQLVGHNTVEVWLTGGPNSRKKKKPAPPPPGRPPADMPLRHASPRWSSRARGASGPRADRP